MNEPTVMLTFNIILAIILGLFWFDNMQRYKMKLLRQIANLDHKIEQIHKMGHRWKLTCYAAKRSMLKDELYRAQKLTNYSGFR
jgi:hypothetical protein